MKNKNWIIFPLALALAAFSGQSFAKDQPDPECKRFKDTVIVNLNLKAANADAKANPQCALAKLGSIVVFQLTPKNELKLGNVVIEPEHPLDDWLHGSNTDSMNLIAILVPGVHVKKKKYQYSDHYFRIKVDGKVIDPRIQVEY